MAIGYRLSAVSGQGIPLRESKSTVFMPYRHEINGIKPIKALPGYEVCMDFTALSVIDPETVVGMTQRPQPPHDLLIAESEAC